MVNTILLENYINNSELNASDISEKLGISEKTFTKKKNNVIDFKLSEIYLMCCLLCIEKDAAKVFFS